MRSAWTNHAPRPTNISPTTDFPEAIPPVKPTFSINSAGSASPHLRRLDCIEHEHGNGQWPHAAGDGRNRTCNFSDLRVNVAHERGTLFAECLFPFGVAGEKALKLGLIGH